MNFGISLQFILSFEYVLLRMYNYVLGSKVIWILFPVALCLVWYTFLFVFSFKILISLFF